MGYVGRDMGRIVGDADLVETRAYIVHNSVLHKDKKDEYEFFRLEYIYSALHATAILTVWL